MKNNLNKYLLILIIFPSFLIIGQAHSQEDQTKEFVILIDDYHGQFINSSLLTGAINDLKDFGFSVILSNNAFSNSTLTGVDLVIIPNPGKKSFEFPEITALRTWLKTENKGLIVLCNPYVEGNDSLTGNNAELDQIISMTEVGLDPEAFHTTDSVTNKPVTVVTLETQNKNSLTLYNVNPKVIDENGDNLTLTTLSTSLDINKADVIVSAGVDSFLVDYKGVYSGFGSNNYLFGAFENNNNRFVVGGSTIMFSDLPNENNPSNSWYETNDNSVFWQKMVTWAIHYEQASLVKTPDSENFSLLVFLSIIAGTALIVLGTVVHVTGKEITLFDAKIVQSTIANDENDKDQSPLSKSQKKLQQRMKNKK